MTPIFKYRVLATALIACCMLVGTTLCAEESPGQIIKEFRVKDCPFNQCYQALTYVGIRLCYEQFSESPEPHDTWIDNDGYYAFTGMCYTFQAGDVTQEALLDGVVGVLALYKWESVPNSNLVNLIPKSNSVLEQVVGPYHGHGTLDKITNSVDGMLKGTLIRGRLPTVSLDFPGGTRRELLNAIANAAGDSWVWRVTWAPGGPVVSWSDPSYRSCGVDRVRLEYDVRRGVPIDQSADLLRTEYQTQCVRMGDESVMIPKLDVLDLAVYNGPQQRMDSQQSEISGECYMAIRALLAHDVDKFLAFCHPDGVRDDDRLMPDEELRGLLNTYFETHAKDTERLADLIDPKLLTVQVQGEQLRYVIPVKAEVQSKYGKQFSFTLEQCADKRWRIVQFGL